MWLIGGGFRTVWVNKAHLKAFLNPNRSKTCSKQARSGLKLRFSGSPTSKTASRVQNKRVNFFTQTTPFLTLVPCPSPSPFCALKRALNRLKKGNFGAKIAFSGLKRAVFMLSHHKNGWLGHLFGLELCSLPQETENLLFFGFP